MMPNLAALREGAAEARLQSTMPPVTGPAWLSLATGLSPGSTGIYDFLYRREATGFDFEYMDVSAFRGRSVWDYLSDDGFDVGVVDYPLLAPPYSLNGFVVSGGLGSEGLVAKPDTLNDELNEFDEPVGHMDLRDPKYEELSVFYDDITENLRRRADILVHMLEEQEWDFCWAVLQEPDWFLHLMWKCFDQTHPESEGVSEEEQELFRKFWKSIDEVVGRCVEAAGPEANIVVQSDHGFGPLFDRSFRLNTWLKEQGYLVPKSFAGSHFWVKKRIRNFLSDVASMVNLQELAPGLFQWGKNQTASLAIQLNALDLDETQIFDPGHIGSMGGLYVNERALDDGVEPEQLIENVTDQLLAFGTENELDISIYTPEELYGKKAPGSPDLIVRVDGTMIEDGGWDKPIIDDRPDRLSHQNGSHRRDGVFIASGPQFRETEVEDANVWDVAPTLLHCMEHPVPSTMDGVVLTEIFADDHPVKRIDISSETDRRKGLDEEEQANVEQQLSDLGYFD